MAQKSDPQPPSLAGSRDPKSGNLKTAAKSACCPLKKAVFLDRDGTINHDVGYLSQWENFRWIDGVPDALAQLKKAGFALVVITNQSGVARGYYTSQEVQTLHRKIDTDLLQRAEIKLDGWYYCTHHPDLAPCSCRKPSPELLLKAAKDLGLALSASFMIGDKSLDIMAGLNAGVQGSLLVLTGYGQGDQSKVPPGTPVFPDLPAAAAFILNKTIDLSAAITG
ncbi:MAG: D-glycero-beta-D-manno-heptose 1,7-bisphosphate 7-phosphatase [Deltaproteobacteria bacterium]|jgi:D-glycero-D-manno-heptose 1,7-bisphosphate phosphatase|nr:D-glycero-beta-D-manno-heptose 1,7-bisphosphate 7-phosphatase [Deltaproteobacteria bacterium]